MTVDYTPLGHRLLIRMDELEADIKVEEEKVKTKTGFEFYIPSKNSEIKKEQLIDESAICTGVVTKMGRHAYYNIHNGEPWVSIGDRVMFSRYTGDKVVMNGINYRLIEDTAVLAIISER